MGGKKKRKLILVRGGGVAGKLPSIKQEGGLNGEFKKIPVIWKGGGQRAKAEKKEKSGIRNLGKAVIQGGQEPEFKSRMGKSPKRPLLQKGDGVKGGLRKEGVRKEWSLTQ